MKREESAKIFLRLKEMYHQLNICGFSHASASIVDAIDLRKKEILKLISVSKEDEK
jgi:hypothetical protein